MLNILTILNKTDYSKTASLKPCSFISRFILIFQGVAVDSVSVVSVSLLIELHVFCKSITQEESSCNLHIPNFFRILYTLRFTFLKRKCTEKLKERKKASKMDHITTGTNIAVLLTLLSNPSSLISHG